MNVTHREFIHARCPVEPEVFDYYAVTFSTKSMVQVETVREALRRCRGVLAFQEKLTQKLATETGCRVTTKGLHQTTRTTVTCQP